MAETEFTSEPEMKGWLYKWTNYIQGYRKRWFVLSNGLLTYYRNSNDPALTCRGSINLNSAVIHIVDSSNFVIYERGTQAFHLKATSEIEQQRWVTAFELSKNRAIRRTESDDDDVYDMSADETEKMGIQNVLKTLSAKLDDLNRCNELIERHGTSLQLSLMELEQIESLSNSASKFKCINERAALFKITCNAMINACQEYVQMAVPQGRKWQKMLQHEHEQRLRLEEMVEQLAKQHSSLERSILAAKEASINSPENSTLTKTCDCDSNR